MRRTRVGRIAGVGLALALGLTVAPVAHPRGDRERAVEVTLKGPSGKPASFVVCVVAGGHRSYMTVDRGPTGPVLVPGGEATLTVLGAQDAKGKYLGWAPATVTVAPGQGEVTVKAAAGQRSKGKARFHDGSPAGGATVLAFLPGDPDPRTSWALSSAKAGKDGAFELTGLPNEPVELRAVEQPDDPLSPPTAVAGGTKDVVVTFSPSRARTLRVVDEDGNPVARARVRVLRRSAAAALTRGRGFLEVFVLDERTDPHGNVRTPRLRVGADLSLEVAPPEGRENVASIKIDPWTPTDGDIVLPRAFTATMRVVDEDGRPVRAEVIRIRPRRDADYTLPHFDSLPVAGDADRVVVPGTTAGDRFLATSRTPLTRKVDPEAGMTAKDLDRLMPPPELLGADVGGVFPPCSRSVAVRPESPEATIVRRTRGSPMRVVAKGARSGAHKVALVADLDGALALRTQAFDADDETTLPDIAPGAYRVFVLGPPDADAPAGRTDVTDFTAGEVVVALGPTAPLLVAYEPADATGVHGSVYQGGLLFLTMQPDGPGRLLARGLPPGRYPVGVTAGPPDDEAAAPPPTRRWRRAEVHAETGVEARVTLLPDD